MKKFLTLIAILLFCSISYAANATDSYIEESGNATSSCHTALPSFDNPIRFRPLAVVNEGTVNGFVTCSNRAAINSHGTVWFSATFKNLSHTEGSKEVTCTGVIGKDTGDAQYIIKSVILAPGGRNTMSWHKDQDNDGMYWKLNTNFSCNLPPGVAINEVNNGYYQP